MKRPKIPKDIGRRHGVHTCCTSLNGMIDCAWYHDERIVFESMREALRGLILPGRKQTDIERGRAALAQADKVKP